MKYNLQYVYYILLHNYQAVMDVYKRVKSFEEAIEHVAEVAVVRDNSVFQ